MCLTRLAVPHVQHLIEAIDAHSAHSLLQISCRNNPFSRADEEEKKQLEGGRGVGKREGEGGSAREREREEGRKRERQVCKLCMFAHTPAYMSTCSSSYCYVCALILLYICLLKVQCVLKLLYMSSSYSYCHIYVLILVHMCPHTTAGSREIRGANRAVGRSGRGEAGYKREVLLLPNPPAPPKPANVRWRRSFCAHA